MTQVAPSNFFMSYPEDHHFQTLLAALLAVFLVMGLVLPHLSLPKLQPTVDSSITPVIRAAVMLPKTIDIVKPTAIPKPVALESEVPKPIVQVSLPPREVVSETEVKPEFDEKLVAQPLPIKATNKNHQPRRLPNSEVVLVVPVAKIKIAEPVTSEESQPQIARQQAREQASKSGLMMMRSQLQQLQQTAAQAAIPVGAKRAQASGSNVVAVSDVDAVSFDEAAFGQQALTQQDVQLSSATNTTKYSTGAGVQHQTRQVASAGSATNQANGYGASSGGGAGKTASVKKSGVRDEASIRQVFEQNKSAIFALYHRALRTQPGLQGKMVFKISISADGQMTACELVSSQLGDAELEKKLLTKIRLLTFGALNVAPLTMTYALDFVPS